MQSVKHDLLSMRSFETAVYNGHLLARQSIYSLVLLTVYIFCGRWCMAQMLIMCFGEFVEWKFVKRYKLCELFF